MTGKLKITSPLRVSNVGIFLNSIELKDIARVTLFFVSLIYPLYIKKWYLNLEKKIVEWGEEKVLYLQKHFR